MFKIKTVFQAYLPLALVLTFFCTPVFSFSSILYLGHDYPARCFYSAANIPLSDIVIDKNNDEDFMCYVDIPSDLQMSSKMGSNLKFTLSLDVPDDFQLSSKSKFIFKFDVKK